MLLGYARDGNIMVVFWIDRLGRAADEVTTTIKELLDAGIVIRALREGVDPSTPKGRMIMCVMASFAELRVGAAAGTEVRRDRGA